MRSLAKIVLFFLFLTIVFEGTLRFIFFKIGMPYLIYAKDILLLSLFLVYVFHIIYKGYINKTFFAIFLFVFYGFAIGCFNNLNLYQVLFGFKVLLSFFVGLISICYFKIEKDFFLNAFRIFIPIIFFGLILDYFYPLPWEGLEYEIFGFLIEGSRRRGMFGIPRLSGFGRTSFETSMLLFSFSALYIVINYTRKLEYKFHTKVYDNLLLIMSFVGIIFTTSKTSIFAFLVVVLFGVLLKFYKSSTDIPRFLAKLSIKSVLFFLFIYGIVPPVFSLSSSFLSKYFSLNTFPRFLSFSYIDRFEFTWPNAFQLIRDPLEFFTGRGLGGIGTPQLYFESNLYNPADNLYVYIFVGFGIIVVTILVFYLLYNLFRLNLKNEKNVYFLAFCLVLFFYGATLNVVESSVLTITSGVLLGFSKRGID